MNNKYWIVKPIINGFEFTTIMYGEQDSVRSYIENFIKTPTTFTEISEDIVNALFTIGIKIYAVPAIQRHSNEKEVGGDAQ